MQQACLGNASCMLHNHCYHHHYPAQRDILTAKQKSSCNAPQCTCPAPAVVIQIPANHPIGCKLSQNNTWVQLLPFRGSDHARMVLHEHTKFGTNKGWASYSWYVCYTMLGTELPNIRWALYPASSWEDFSFYVHNKQLAQLRQDPQQTWHTLYKETLKCELDIYVTVNKTPECTTIVCTANQSSHFAQPNIQDLGQTTKTKIWSVWALGAILHNLHRVRTKIQIYCMAHLLHKETIRQHEVNNTSIMKHKWRSSQRKEEKNNATTKTSHNLSFVPWEKTWAYYITVNCDKTDNAQSKSYKD